MKYRKIPLIFMLFLITLQMITFNLLAVFAVSTTINDEKTGTVSDSSNESVTVTEGNVVDSNVENSNAVDPNTVDLNVEDSNATDSNRQQSVEAIANTNNAMSNIPTEVLFPNLKEYNAQNYRDSLIPRMRVTAYFLIPIAFLILFTYYKLSKYNTNGNC